MKRTLVFAALLLISAIVLVIYGKTRIPAPTFHGDLASILPEPPSGWTMKKREIADTPEMKEAVGELLNYDDGVFVDYTNGTYRLSVYIAYWTPGKMSQRLVASHTPDVCWVGNGWVKQSSERKTHLTLGGKILPPVESRLFIFNENTEYVWFWHIVGDEAKSYATGYAPPWYAPLTDMLSKGLNQREEQFFIRISAQVPLDSFTIKPVLDLVLENIPFPQKR